MSFLRLVCSLWAGVCYDSLSAAYGGDHRLVHQSGSDYYDRGFRVHTGPLGVNMATYVGYQTAGVPGALVATLGVITPGAILILIIAGFLQKFRSNRSVEAVFAGLRPASTALIAAAGLSVAYSVFTASDALSPNSFPAIQWTAVVLTLAMFAAMKWTPLKKLHPIAFIAAGAAAGILLQL